MSDVINQTKSWVKKFYILLVLRSLLGDRSQNKGYTVEQDRNYVKTIQTSLAVHFSLIVYD